MGVQRRTVAPVLRQATEDAQTYARDDDFEILSQAGSQVTGTTNTSVLSGSSGRNITSDHRPWIRKQSVPNKRSSFMSVSSLRKYVKNEGIHNAADLHRAITAGNAKAIQQWLDAGNSANAALEGVLPLNQATKAWSPEPSPKHDGIVKVLTLLIDYGADVNRVNGDGTPFHNAMRKDGNGRPIDPLLSRQRRRYPATRPREAFSHKRDLPTWGFTPTRGHKQSVPPVPFFVDLCRWRTSCNCAKS